MKEEANKMTNDSSISLKGLMPTERTFPNAIEYLLVVKPKKKKKKNVAFRL